MSPLKRSLLILVLLISCIGCDQIMKDVARQHLASQEPMSWFHNTVRLEYAENTGAFLSFGVGFSEEVRMALFQIIPALALIGLTIFLVVSQSASTLATVAWCLVLSGGVSNLLDRMLHHGRVIDFMNLGIGPIRTGIFNVADACISVGIALILFLSFRSQDQSAVK